MQKRGQITVFIVVGIVILFAVGLLLYAASILPGLGGIPEKETELQQFIGVCLSQTSEDAINTVGATGGYLDIPESIAINERSYFAFAPRTQPKIPLWYYRGEARPPTKDFISEQISKYILDRITPCFQNFDMFKDRYALQLIGNTTVNVSIGDTAVTVFLHYPLQVEEKSSGSISKEQNVVRKLDVKLGRMWAMALEILRSENQQTFFENLTVELMSTNSDIPFTGMDFSCVPKMWKKSQEISLIKSMLYYNLQKVTLSGNKYTFFDSSDKYAANHFVFDIGKQYSDIAVGFSYPTTARFEMHVRPNDAELLRSNMGHPESDLLKFLCINTWHFTYDVEYPLLTTLRDEAAFNGNGFTFNFAFPVTVNHNQGNKTDFTPAMFDTPDISYGFCTTVSQYPVDIRVKNEYTNEEIYKASVDYKCVRYLCDLGNTTSDGGAYRLRAKLPSSCSSGLLTARAPNYLDGSTVYDGSNSATILLKPLKTFKINFDVHDSDRLGNVQNMPNDYIATLFITNPSIPDYQQIYSTDSNMSKEIQLIDGDADYKLEALLIRKGNDYDRLIGGYIGDWNVPYSIISEKSEITFHLVQGVPIAVTEQEQIDTAGFLFENKSYQEPLKPTFT